MEAALVIAAILLSLVGILGSVLPGLPGHPLNYIAMWCVQWAYHSFSTTTLIVFAVLTVVLIALEYILPIWLGKKFGATREGIIGSVIGMIIGMFLTPVGIVLGTLAGAIIGDMIAGRTGAQATRSGIATVFGTFITIGIKLLLAGVMTSFVIYELVVRWLS